MSDRFALNISAITDAYRVAIRASCPGAEPLARRVLLRLDPDHWALEWNLPLWLAEAVGLPAEVASEIVLSNLFGLTSLRLRDDLADDELAEDDRLAAAGLAQACHALALGVYRQRLGSVTAFWDFVDSSLEAWQSVSEGKTQFKRADDPGGLSMLAARGAPLKISAMAVCLLAGRPERFAFLEPCLDHAIAAMALYDDACDWREDLQAGRWNSLVETGAASDAGHLLAALMGGRAIARHFARIDTNLERAAAQSAEARVPKLTAYLNGLRARIRRQGLEVESRYSALGDSALKIVFPTFAVATRYTPGGVVTNG